MQTAEYNNQTYSYEGVAQLFHLPMLEASILCGLDLSDFKKLMKKLGIHRWPYSYKRDVTRCDITTFVEFKVQHSKFPVGIQKISKKQQTLRIDKMSIANLINE